LVKREDDSSTLNSDNAKAEVLFHNSSSIGEKFQMPNHLETVDNGIVLSSLSLQNPVESYVSTGHDKSLNKNNQIDEGGSYQGLVAIESFSDGKVIVNTRYVQLYDIIILVLLDCIYYYLFLFLSL